MWIRPEEIFEVNAEKVSLLDHGYSKFVEHWGSDERVVEAARMSTDKGFLGWGEYHCLQCGAKDEQLLAGDNCQMCGSTNVEFGSRYFECTQCGQKTSDEHRAKYCTVGDDPQGKNDHRFTKRVPGDEKLLAYLYDNKHATPFEMAGMIVEIQAPIMVFREWHRHRTASYNEMSGRYIALPNLNYVPTVERLMINSKSNKQAGTIKGAEELTLEQAEQCRQDWIKEYEDQEALYQRHLKRGVPKELARIHIGVGRYSRMRASANLRNWLAFLTLRMDVKAQWEIRQYANEVGNLISQLYPRTWKLFIGKAD